MCAASMVGPTGVRRVHPPSAHPVTGSRPKVRRFARFEMRYPGAATAASPRTAALLKYALVLTVVIVALAVFRYYKRPSPSSPLNLQNLQITRLTENGMVSGVAISPDGRFAVYAKGDGEKEGLWIRQVATRSDVQIV